MKERGTGEQTPLEGPLGRRGLKFYTDLSRALGERGLEEVWRLDGRLVAREVVPRVFWRRAIARGDRNFD